MLKAKKILLGVTGSIAAYKIASLVRLLKKSEAEVKVIMTPSATDFITPLTLSTLSGNPVHTQFFEKDDGTWHNHVELGLWADVMLIAPASANTLAKCVQGMADNLLIATYLSARCPVYFAPAMDLDMYQHFSTQENLSKLEEKGNFIIEAESGSLASGLEGQGRMAEPETLIAELEAHFANAQRLQGKKILITAGPTYEALDPVRFIGNHSSGKMGFAIAEAFAQQGAEVMLVTGPTTISVHHSGITRIDVQSAQEMYEAAQSHFSTADITVLAAAVADYRPAKVAEQKIKKDSTTLNLALEKTVDIAASLGKKKKARQKMVGFALETENEEANAKAKLKKKNLDLIVLNSLNTKGAGFGYDTNEVNVFDQKGLVKSFPLQKKTILAQHLVNLILEHA